MGKRKTTDEFISEAKAVHGERFDYSETKYINGRTKVKIVCKKHKVFEQRPDSHILNEGCPQCNIINRTKTTEQFIIEAELIHGDLYDYSLVEYENTKSKVIIICKTHGIFNQEPISHLKTNGCNKCGGKNRKTTEEFIRNAKITHKRLYDYSLVDYKNGKTKVEIICKKHGVFSQTPENHLSVKGCPRCKSSKGEKK